MCQMYKFCTHQSLNTDTDLSRMIYSLFSHFDLGIDLLKRREKKRENKSIREKLSVEM